MKKVILLMALVILFTGCSKKADDQQAAIIDGIDSTLIGDQFRVGTYTYHPPAKWGMAPKEIFDLLEGGLIKSIDDPNVKITPLNLHIDMDTKSMLVVSRFDMKNTQESAMIDNYIARVKAAGNPNDLKTSKVSRPGLELTRLALTAKGYIDIRYLTPAADGGFYQFDYVFPEDKYPINEPLFESSNLTIMRGR